MIQDPRLSYKKPDGQPQVGAAAGGDAGSIEAPTSVRRSRTSDSPDGQQYMGKAADGDARLISVPFGSSSRVVHSVLTGWGRFKGEVPACAAAALVRRDQLGSHASPRPAA